MKTLSYLLFALVFLVTGCSVNEDNFKDNNLSERGMNALEYQVLKSGEYACDGGAYLDMNESISFFRSDKEEAIEEFNREYALVCGEEISFDGTAVIIRAGTKNSGGHEFEVLKMEKNEDFIDIKLNLVQKGSVATMALTNPFIVFLFPDLFLDVNVTLI